MKRVAILLFALLPNVPLCAQSVMTGMESGGGRLFPSDAVVFELREVKRSLPCAVAPTRTELGFDLNFHAGHTVRLRLQDLAGEGSVLTSIFRVIPAGEPEKPVYFEQKWRVPPIEENAAGAVALDSSFMVGEGDYYVDWLLRDSSERVCSAFWRISARSAIKEGQIAAGLRPGQIMAAGGDYSLEQEAAGNGSAHGLSVTVFLNVGPDVAGGANMSQAGSDALLSILRGILREPRIGEISLTVFNLEQRQIIFEQENIRRVNFASLKKAMDALTLGAVSVSQLAEEAAEAKFLIRVATEKIERKRSDALIFVGPKTLDESGMTRDVLRQLGDPRCPVFYLTYLPAPELYPWRDLIGSAVRQWRGREFSISRPTDLVSAWSKIMSQLGTNSLRAPER